MRVGYVRVSTGEQADTDALEQQTARVEKVGAVLIFSDVESGRSDQRTEFNKMLALCKQGKVTELVVTRIDRLARSVITIHRTLVTLEECGVKLVVLDAPVDTSSPFGWFSVNQMAGLAEFESRLLSNRIKHGLNYFREQKKASPRPPFGYRRIDEKYAPDMTLHDGKTNWEIALEIIDYFLLDLSTLRNTAQYVLEKYGISWTAAGLKYWMTNPVLQGDTVYNVRGNLNAPHKWERHQDTHQALISKAKYQLILNKLEANKTKYSYGNNKNTNKEQLPLVDQIICGDCGYKCFCLKRKWSTYRIRCKKRDNLGDSFCKNRASTYLEDIISAVDAALAGRYEEIQKYTVENLSSKQEDDPELIARLEQLKALRLLPQNSIIQNAIEQTLLDIQALKQREVAAKQVSAELVKTLNICFIDQEYWSGLSWTDKRTVYRELIDCVKVLNGEVVDIKLLV